MGKIIPLFILLTTWAACVTVEFEAPQPLGERSLEKFPRKLRGSYVNEDDGMLMINKYSFITGSKDSIDVGDETYLDRNMHLRRVNQSYVLSTRDDVYWEVILINVDKDSLFLSEVSGQNERAIIELNKITDVRELKTMEGEIEKYLINPSKSEFERILKSDVFTPMFKLNKVR